jgi:hypothetical protein
MCNVRIPAAGPDQVSLTSYPITQALHVFHLGECISRRRNDRKEKEKGNQFHRRIWTALSILPGTIGLAAGWVPRPCGLARCGTDGGSETGLLCNARPCICISRTYSVIMTDVGRANHTPELPRFFMAFCFLFGSLVWSGILFAFEGSTKTWEFEAL